MRQLLTSIFTLVLTASIALGVDAQTKAEIDEFMLTSRIRRSIHSKWLGVFRSRGRAASARQLARLGDRVKTTEDFITGIASKSFLSGKPYLVKFADGHTQPTGECLRAHLAEVQENKR